MPYSIIFLLLLASAKTSTTEESAQYLRNVIRDLKEMKNKSNARRVAYTGSTLNDILPTTITPHSSMHRRIEDTSVPELSLTKGQLASLYQNAVSKGQTIRLETGDDTFVDAAIHELDDSDQDLHSSDLHHSVDEAESLNSEGTGYYYYYYPIKSFLDEFTSKPDDDNHDSHSHTLPSHNEVIHIKPKPNYNYHSHTHQHNVKISTTKAADGEKKNKLEPLFMAISGFLGMAVMFVLSVLVFPKFGIKPHKPKGKQDLGEIARIALRAIEGQDCRERFACELTKTARSLNLYDNRLVRLFWRVTPTSISKQFARFSKYNDKQMKCTAIPCKKKQPVVKTNPKNKKKSNKKS